MKRTVLLVTLLGFVVLAESQKLPTVYTLQECLAKEVQRMIDAGHLAPGLCNFEQHYAGSDRSYAAFYESDEYWHNPAETIYILCMAIPYLPTGMQDAAKTYLQSEFDFYPPYEYVHMGPDGARREASPLPQEHQGGNHPGPYSHRPGAETTTRGTGHCGWWFNQFNFYACWKYAEMFPSEAQSIMNYIRNKVEPIPDDSFIRPYPNVLNKSIAGYYGYLFLQDMVGETRSATVQGYLDTALQKKLQFLQDDPKQIEGEEVAGLLYLVPELGDYLNQNARTRVEEILNYQDWAAPYWHISRAEEVTRYDSNRGFMEGDSQHIYETWVQFLARAYILKWTRAELEKYLDAPAVYAGDLYYIQMLVATIEAPGDTPTQLILAGNPQTIQADGVSTSIITARACDEYGITVTNSTAEVTFTLTGTGSLIGTNPVNAQNGVATITYQSGTQEEIVTITGTSNGLTQGTVDVNVVANNAPTAPTGLLCNGQINPLDLSEFPPELSWTFNDSDTGDSQTAYQLIVADNQTDINSNAGNVWDRGKVASSANSVTYAGQTLQPGTTYYWKVMTWDNIDVSGPYSQAAKFTTTSEMSTGFAIQFDGVDDYVDLGNNSNLDINSGNATGITVEMWIKRTEVGQEGHFFARYVWAQGGYEVWIDYSDHLHFRLAVPDNVIINASGYSLTSGEWYHIACQTDGTTGKIYIDGIDRTSGVDGTLGMPVSIDYGAYIGTDYVGGGYAGVVIDEVRISNIVRYTNNFTPLSVPFTPDSNTVALWHFDEGSGAATNDASSNNISGSLVNGPIWVKGFSTIDRPRISISNSRLDFGEIEIGKTGMIDFQITNIGAGTLSGTVSTDKMWIEVQPTSFNGNNVTVNVTVNNSVLNQKEGEHKGKVNITSNGGNSSVEVTLKATCVLAKPNPYNPEKGNLIFFGDGIIPGNTTIKIYTLSGELIKTLGTGDVEQSEIPRGEILLWSGRNENGKIVASGIYIYIYESPREKGVGKFTVIRQ